MAVTIDNVEEAYLAAKARFETWKADFEGKFYGPVAQPFILEFWNNLTPEQHGLLEQRAPEGYAQLKKLVEGGSKNANNLR